MRSDARRGGQRSPDSAENLLRDPFAWLGPHPSEDGGVIVRAMLPLAEAAEAIDGDTGAVLAPLEIAGPDGLRAGRIPAGRPYLLRIHWPGGVEQVTEDPYSFGLLLGDVDLYLLAEGNHRELGRCLGAQCMSVSGVAGVRFAVWAPNARRVSVVGEFNGWDGRRHPMRLRQNAGVWELFIPRLGPGTFYKYEILGPRGLLPLKADPVALQAEPPPGTASVVAEPADIEWTDQDWMRRRAGDLVRAPVSVYELHAGSWRRHAGPGQPPLNWDELGDQLVPYVQGMGFTHIELLPVMAHPFGGSWGYQPLGLFAPQASFGSPAGFARFIDRCHGAGIGVILDWVPAHFPTDAHGLMRFDGTALYEHEDPREGFHQDWNTLIYNLGRSEVHGFLIASALHWLERYHIDGLRVDAVASMLYRDYSRSPGQWIPNRYGGRENLEAVAFLRHFNDVVAERCPGAITLAEESTAWPGVTHHTHGGGLGFTYKWNMGWMHDTLFYMARNPIYRAYDHDKLTFGLLYAFTERFVLPLSHDEVVHGKGSLLGKMPGDRWQQFANLRAYLSFMWTYPGKKLLFMGGEFAQQHEWNHDRQLDWELLNDPLHAGVQKLVADLNRLYQAQPALHQGDCSGEGFRWIVVDDRQHSVFAYCRYGDGGTPPVAAVINFTPVPRQDYRIGLPRGGYWREALNSDAQLYGGSDMGNGGGVMAQEEPSHGLPHSAVLTVPPLAAVVLVAEQGT